MSVRYPFSVVGGRWGGRGVIKLGSSVKRG